MSATEYRLSFDVPPPHEVAAIEDRYGKDVWSEFDWDLFSSWHTVTKITTEPWDQYNTLVQWAHTKEQPIRNVTLEQREAPQPDEGWQTVDAAPRCETTWGDGDGRCCGRPLGHDGLHGAGNVEWGEYERSTDDVR